MKEKRKTILSDELIKDIAFFDEDLAEMTNQLQSGEKLYEDIYKVFNSYTGGRYNSVKSPRDLAELAKALVSVRSLCNDAAFKRHQVRKNVSDIVSKRTDTEVEGEDLIKEAARVILNEVRTSNEGKSKAATKRVPTPISASVQQELDATIDGYIRNGEIALSTNDKLIGMTDHVEFRYDEQKKTFVATDDRTGQIVRDFPKDRLPVAQISRIGRADALTITGETYKLLGAK